MLSSSDDVDLNPGRPRSRLVRILWFAAGALTVLFGIAVMIGRFMQVNVLELTVTGIWDLLVRLFASV